MSDEAKALVVIGLWTSMHVVYFICWCRYVLKKEKANED